MAIKRNAAGGRYIQVPGEYRVRAVETLVKVNSKGKTMRVVLFRTSDELEISGYFTKGVTFHDHNMKELKIASGLTPDKAPEELIGREVGILVEAGEANPETGRVFMQITGYDKPELVGVAPASQPTGNATTSPGYKDEVPF